MPLNLEWSQAYLQLRLDGRSQNLVVIDTNRGSYKFEKFSFHVASAHAMFWNTMETILEGIPLLICYFDDIIIIRATWEKHVYNLEQVLQRLQNHGLYLKRLR